MGDVETCLFYVEPRVALLAISNANILENNANIVFLGYTQQYEIRLLEIAGQRPTSQGYQVTLTLKRTSGRSLVLYWSIRVKHRLNVGHDHEYVAMATEI